MTSKDDAGADSKSDAPKFGTSTSKHDTGVNTEKGLDKLMSNETLEPQKTEKKAAAAAAAKAQVVPKAPSAPAAASPAPPNILIKASQATSSKTASAESATKKPVPPQQRVVPVTVPVSVPNVKPKPVAPSTTTAPRATTTVAAVPKPKAPIPASLVKPVKAAVPIEPIRPTTTINQVPLPTKLNVLQSRPTGPKPAPVRTAIATTTKPSKVVVHTKPSVVPAPPGATTTKKRKAPTSVAASASSGTKQQSRQAASSSAPSVAKQPRQSGPPPLGIAPAMPLADPVVVKLVHDISGLLQQYGPLTRTQLEHNLPNSRTRPNILKDVLQLLVTLGVVQKVLGETDKYCVLRGIPRTDVILPRDVLGEVESATTQWKSSLKRAQILKEALLKNKDGNAKEVLSNILREFPEIMHDPVYVAALRNMQVDIAAVEKERIKR